MIGRRGLLVLVAVGVTATSSGCAAVAGQASSLTFHVDGMECGPAKAANAIGEVCSFLAYYGNVSSRSVQVEPATTMVLDKQGRQYSPVANGADSQAFLLQPGRQQGISWSVTLPVNTKPTLVKWHGASASVRLDLPPAPAPSGVPSTTKSPSPTVSASPPPPVVPSTSPTPSAPVTTPVVTPTTSKPTVKPTKTKPSVTPSKSTPTPSKTPTHTPSPATQTTTHRPPVIHHTTQQPPPTQNSTNPGGGSGGIG